MALSNTILKEALKAIITSKEELLQKRLEGGDLASIRNNDFITGNFKSEDLITPSGGIYDVNKKMAKWGEENLMAPGIDPEEAKKKAWKEEATLSSKEISKQICNWLREDIIPDLAIAINTQIKLADIDIVVPSGVIICGAYPNAAPVKIGLAAPIPSVITIT
tara:strand:- start:411 stop:899 length:489 start_codon:yes stop_codon:yes gene_type:complete